MRSIFFDRRDLLGGLAACAAAGSLSRKSLAADAFSLPEGLRRGINLPDQAPRRPGERASDQALAVLRARGLTHIRLPVLAEAALPAFSGPATIGVTFDDLDRALERLMALGFVVSVDLHPGAQFQKMQREEPEKAHRILRVGWAGLAGRLARWPAQGVFAELLNEPATSDDIWRPFVEDLARSVRERLPATTLIVGPAPYQRIEALTRWRPLADRNVVYAVHYYDPLVFTHQGLTWDATSPYAPLAGVPFPLLRNDPAMARLAEEAQGRGEGAASALAEAGRMDWTPSTIATQFAALREWSAAQGAPIVVNEFGVLRFKARPRDRIAWIGAVRTAVEAQGFGWAHWDYSGGFGVADESGNLDRGVVDALLPHR